MNIQNPDTFSSLSFYQKEKLSAIEAKHEAQKIAFGPMVFQATKALRDLKILEAIDNSTDGLTLPEIVSVTQISAYGVRVLVEAGLGIGLLLWQNEKYVLTKTGFFILHDPMTRANMDFVNDINYQGFFHLTESIQEGKPIGLKHFGEQWSTIYQALSSLPLQAKESWFAFDHFYSDDSFSKVLPIVFSHTPSTLLDVGGNTGKWARQCIDFSKEVQVTIADLPQQIVMAKEETSQHPDKNRISFYPVNILQPEATLPTGFDAIWMSQFLDCFSDEEITEIATKAHKALKENGTLFIMETFWDRQKYPTSAFCLQQTSLYFTCMANGNSQMYRSDIFIACIEKAGFTVVEQTDNIGISHTLLQCKKK
ncbi:class I SAM-dependent methyltransferase [Xanthocytophaga flava]|uniref:class I SAM-dependent methyltransferase n=1 Tax=Xanthocytophaga flava TaxID=3048013 RepID=UPI0028D49123|nr:class I SAM-dependent methyltransferase [Xanthocytophaga flavus]MDJ1472192.1 class I SAM-dependent methyltransferase [Xanthocytophaga flavus]